MVLPSNIQLELYVASDKHPDRVQYENSQKVLKLIDLYGVRDKMKIHELDCHLDDGEILPVLESTHLGVGVFSDYIGLEEVIEELESLGLRKQNAD